MAERPPELSPAAQRMLREFRISDSPGVDDRDRGWHELSERLREAPTEEVVASNGRYYAKVVALTVAIAAGLLLAVKLVGLGVTTLADREHAPAMEAPYQGGAESEGGTAVARGPEAAPKRAKARDPQPARAPEASAGEAEPAPTEVASEPNPDEVPPRPASLTEPPTRRGESPRPRATRSASTDDAAAELAIIKRVDEAIRRGDTATALAQLQQHAERFPHGVLADERRVLHAEVLCAAGRKAEARDEVRRFLATRAGSASAGRMRNACPEPNR